MSYEKEKQTVEEYYEDIFPRALRRYQRIGQYTDGQFAEYLGVGVDALRKYYNDGTLPGSSTLIKIMSKLGKSFAIEILFTAGIVFEDTTPDNQNNQKLNISTIAERVGQ